MAKIKITATVIMPVNVEVEVDDQTTLPAVKKMLVFLAAQSQMQKRVYSIKQMDLVIQDSSDESLLE